MGKLIIAAMAGALVMTGQAALAADATGTRTYCDARWRDMGAAERADAQGYDHFLNRCLARCPARNNQEPQNIYEDRAHRYCDARWQRMLMANTAGDETYDHYVSRCAKACAIAYWPDALPALWLLGFELTRLIGDNNEAPASP